MPPRRPHQVIALPPIGPHRADFLRGSKRVPQQTIGVQLHQPLTLLHIALAPRQILRLLGIHQIHFETSFFENVVDCDPVHPSRLQSDGSNRTLLQPHCHLLQFRRSTSEAAYGLAVPCRRHGHIVGFVADINACGVGMHDFQTEIFALDFPRHLTPLLAVHLVPVIWCWAAACFLVSLHLLRFHANLSTVNSTRLGPVGDPYTVSPSGSGRCSFQNHAATIYTIASTGAMLLCRAETRQRRNAALAAEPCCASDFNSREDAWHSSHTLLTQFLSHTTTPTGWALLLSPKSLT